jgi:beta-lactamase regulating signal transducer with metallopeptidase domain
VTEPQQNGVSKDGINVTFRTALVALVATGQIFMLVLQFRSEQNAERRYAEEAVARAEQFNSLKHEHVLLTRQGAISNYMLSLETKDRPRLRMPEGLAAQLEAEDRDATALELSRGRQNVPAREYRPR